MAKRKPNTGDALAEAGANPEAGGLFDLFSLPPAPSAPLLDLLHQDLPWSVTLTVDQATPPRRAAQPDRDAVLEQAERCDPALLDTEVTDALQRRRQLRHQHTTGHRVHAHLWDRIDASSKQERDRDSSREL